MSTIEKIRKTKLPPEWLPWISIFSMALLLITLILNISSGKAGLAALSSCGVSLFALSAFGISQARVNKRLLEEIDKLRSSQNPTP